jgi:Fur family transcriptional regulator, peroxide stress response regulator
LKAFAAENISPPVKARPHPKAADPLARLTAACREAGLAVTPQRAVIYGELVQSFDHPSPEALFERVKPRLPQVSLATIYKTLDVLVTLGLANELASTGDKKRFDGRIDRHHHLVCTRCKSITDYDDKALDALPAPKGLPGFKAEFISIHVHGLCRDCAGSARA